MTSVPAVEMVIAEAWPVCLDETQRARAEAHGVAAVGKMQFESVVFDGPRFRLAMHCEDQRGAEVAFLFPMLDAWGDTADVCAWIPETGRLATLLGVQGTLGLPRSRFAWLPPLPILHETVLDWLRAEDGGFFIIEPELAAVELSGVTLACADRAAALRLHARFAPFVKKPLNVVVPRKAA